jgi:acetyl esterase
MKNLAPEALEYIKAFNSMPAMYEMDPEEAREMLAQTKKTVESLESIVNVNDYSISVSFEESIRARVYTPKTTGPFSALLYLHGGGWVTGSIESSDPSCRLLAAESNRVVISIDYRLAPEYKFPIPLEDSYTSLNWIIENATKMKIDPTNIVVGGDSAGGNLAAALILKSIKENGPKISGQVLLYPVTSLSLDTSSYQKYAEGYGLSKKLMEWFCTHYIKSEEDRKNPFAAPLLADKLSDFPPSIRYWAPVINVLSSLAKNKTKLAISSLVP